MNVREACEIVLGDPLDVILTKCSEHSIDQAVIFALTALEEYPDARAECGDRLKSIEAVLKAWANCGKS